MMDFQRRSTIKQNGSSQHTPSYIMTGFEKFKNLYSSTHTCSLSTKSWQDCPPRGTPPTPAPNRAGASTATSPRPKSTTTEAATLGEADYQGVRRGTRTQSAPGSAGSVERMAETAQAPRQPDRATCATHQTTRAGPSRPPRRAS
jgi:hypothetical protein